MKSSWQRVSQSVRKTTGASTQDVITVYLLKLPEPYIWQEKDGDVQLGTSTQGNFPFLYFVTPISSSSVSKTEIIVS